MIVDEGTTSLPLLNTFLSLSLPVQSHGFLNQSDGVGVMISQP